MHITDYTVAHRTLTGLSSVFCPWVLGDGLLVTVAWPGEALLTDVAELGPEGHMSWPGPGCGDNEWGGAQVPMSPTTLCLSKLLSTFWPEAFFFF